MLEDLKEILKDDSLHLFLGQVKRLHLASDMSYLKVEVLVWPEERLIMTEMTWDNVGPNSGFYSFPSVGDAVLCCSAEGDVDQSYIIKRLSSEEDKIPVNAASGDSVFKTLSGKKIWNTSDTRINLSKGDTEPTENIVLGQRHKVTYSDHLAKLISFMENVVNYMDKYVSHDHLGNMGFKTGTPTNASQIAALKSELNTLKSDINTLKSNKVDNEYILSDLTYTEK